jgi:DNA ligase (NAD+)
MRIVRKSEDLISSYHSAKSEARKAFGIDDIFIENLICTNENCIAKLIKKMSLFVSKDALNVLGLSDALLKKLIDEGIICEFADLYKLASFKDKIISFDGFGEQSYENLITAIEQSRNVKLFNFIYSLGIPGFGLAKAKLICNTYKNDFNVIKNLTNLELEMLDGIGEKLAKNWVKYFSNNENSLIIRELLKELNIEKQDSLVKANILSDVKFVITGKVERFENRTQMKNMIEDNGGEVLSSINNKVNYLINNNVNSTSSKNNKAKELGIKVISENEFMDMFFKERKNE